MAFKEIYFSLFLLLYAAKTPNVKCEISIGELGSEERGSLYCRNIYVRHVWSGQRSHRQRCDRMLVLHIGPREWYCVPHRAAREGTTVVRSKREFLARFLLGFL